jgi:hypothetical protein
MRLIGQISQPSIFVNPDVAGFHVTHGQAFFRKRGKQLGHYAAGCQHHHRVGVRFDNGHTPPKFVFNQGRGYLTEYSLVCLRQIVHGKTHSHALLETL